MIIVFKEQKMLSIICVWGVFAQYAWVKPLKDEKGEIVLNVFIKIWMNVNVNESDKKPIKIRDWSRKRILRLAYVRTIRQ